LDGLKSSEDETRALKARAAIRQLDANSSRIRHETEYTALLPAEWDVKQPDHAILSTALFFRLNDVLFVSNDINLRNKAQSLGLNAQDPSRMHLRALYRCCVRHAITEARNEKNKRK
jgi:predicted ribonuclease YlaK